MPNSGGAEADLEICLSFLAAKAKKGNRASDSVLLTAKGEACWSPGEADFPDSMLEESSGVGGSG